MFSKEQIEEMIKRAGVETLSRLDDFKDDPRMDPFFQLMYVTILASVTACFLNALKEMEGANE